jgi:hypothetical protein
MDTRELEQEAVEVNRRFNNYQALRQQHRERVIELLDASEDNREIKGLARILLLTNTTYEEG